MGAPLLIQIWVELAGGDVAGASCEFPIMCRVLTWYTLDTVFAPPCVWTPPMHMLLFCGFFTIGLGFGCGIWF